MSTDAGTTVVTVKRTRRVRQEWSESYRCEQCDGHDVICDLGGMAMNDAVLREDNIDTSSVYCNVCEENVTVINEDGDTF